MMGAGDEDDQVSVFLSVSRVLLSVCVSVCLSVCLSLASCCLSVYLSVCLSAGMCSQFWSETTRRTRFS